jgi:hypothetical protein
MAIRTKKTYGKVVDVVSSNNVQNSLAAASKAPHAFADSINEPTVTNLWSGYIRALKEVNNLATLPRYYDKEAVQSKRLEFFLAKDKVDPDDFAYSITKHWKAVREYVDEETGGASPIRDVPNLYTFNDHLSVLVIWYKDLFVGNGRTLLYRIGMRVLPAYIHKSRKTLMSELPTEDELLRMVLESS